MGVQPRLFTVLPQGVWILRGFVSRADQERMREEIREVARLAPFYTPQMPYGGNFNLKITNAGLYGWTSDANGMRYTRTQPRRVINGGQDNFEGRPWPGIPAGIMMASRLAAHEAGFTRYEPNVCLFNYYERGKGSLGRHRDDTRGEDFNTPIVTISLGDGCELGIGGLEYENDCQFVDFNSGDVLVLGNVGRLLYHQIRNVSGNSDLLSKGGRISATLRRATFESRGSFRGGIP